MAKQKVKIAKFTAIFEAAEEGGYTVTVPTLPGCVTEGDTFEEAVEMSRDAIRAYLTSLKKHHEPAPNSNSESFLGVIEVPLA